MEPRVEIVTRLSFLIEITPVDVEKLRATAAELVRRSRELDPDAPLEVLADDRRSFDLRVRDETATIRLAVQPPRRAKHLTLQYDDVLTGRWPSSGALAGQAQLEVDRLPSTRPLFALAMVFGRRMAQKELDRGAAQLAEQLDEALRIVDAAPDAASLADLIVERLLAEPSEPTGPTPPG